VVEVKQPIHRATEEQNLVDVWTAASLRVLDAPLELAASGLQIWRALTTAVVQISGGAASDAAETTTKAVAAAAPVAIEPAVAVDEYLARGAGTAQSPAARRQATPTRPVLESLRVEQLDRLATAHGVDDYPRSGTKSEKVAALAAADLALEELTVEELDRIASAREIEGHPHAGRKQERIDVLEETALASGLHA
jgi:hypothetical protein